jgi:hypothetical protein
VIVHTRACTMHRHARTRAHVRARPEFNVCVTYSGTDSGAEIYIMFIMLT